MRLLWNLGLCVLVVGGVSSQVLHLGHETLQSHLEANPLVLVTCEDTLFAPSLQHKTGQTRLSANFKFCSLCCTSPDLTISPLRQQC